MYIILLFSCGGYSFFLAAKPSAKETHNAAVFLPFFTPVRSAIRRSNLSAPFPIHPDVLNTGQTF